MSEREIILETHGLSKRYKDKLAVNSLSMTIRRGDIYGFVGLNGSGKTTLIRLVTGLIRPTAGTYSLFGISGGESRTTALRRVSSMVETPAVYTGLTGMDNLKIQCDILCEPNKNRPAELLEFVGLDPHNTTPAKGYSLGMRQRLGIAMALVGNPEFMLLDEPTNGLDPGGIVEIRELLLRLNRENNITILISSHILAELSKLATTYGFIHNGVLLQEIDAPHLLGSDVPRLNIRTSDDATAMTVLQQFYPVVPANGGLCVTTSESVTDVILRLKDHGIAVLSAEALKNDLEDYFIRLIGGHSHGTV